VDERKESHEENANGSLGDLDEKNLKSAQLNVDSSDGLVRNGAKKAQETVWKTVHYRFLPVWLQDNEYLHNSHRPPLATFSSCLKSIFRVHTETGNIWSHLLGCVAFVVIAVSFFSRPEDESEAKFAFLPFFLGVVGCMGLSCAHHTVHCHSEPVAKVFRKLDYVGIALLIVGSFIPWLHYGFYCNFGPKIGYMALIIFLGTCCILVCLLDKFSTPRFRPLRAALFVALGLSAVIPGCHHLILYGFWTSVNEASAGWMILMAVLYISGAVIYAMRVPERFFPGKCDIMFQSHQIFHVLVVAAALVHYHGIASMVTLRLAGTTCHGYNVESSDMPFKLEL